MSSSTIAIVCYCPRCDYFIKTAVQEPVGTHGCVKCHQFMEVYLPQEMASPDWTHRPDRRGANQGASERTEP